MTVRARLLLMLGGITLLLVVPAAYGVTQVQRVRDLAEELEIVHTADIDALGDMRASLAELDRVLRSYVSLGDPAYREAVQRELTFVRSNLALLGQNYRQEISPAVALVDSLQTATAAIEELMETNQLEAATARVEQTRPLLDRARASLAGIDDALDERGRVSVAEARRVSESAARTTALAAGIALLLTLALGLWATDALSRPLRRLSEATGRVADGDFVAPDDLPYERSDEIGHLSRSFGSMTSRLAELDRLKAEFVSLASHELKTPINVIAGYAELLDEGLYGEMEPKQREVLDLVQEQTRALTRLVNQLLDLSRFEAGGLRIEPQEVELERLLSDVEQSFRALATQKRITFDVEHDSSLPETGRFDPDRLRHEVLSNLLSNSFKFTSAGGTIRLRAWSTDETLRMEVSDTGIGIPEDQLEHVFEKYYQVGAEAKAKGSGLGLAIAKHVVEAHEGTIGVRSTVGEGTTFEISMPLKGPAE